MSHILIVGGGPAGLSAAFRLAERGQRVTLAAARPPAYNRSAGLIGVDLPEETARQLRAMGAQSLSGHEVMQALSRRLLQYEASGKVRYLPYHRLLKLAVAAGGICAGGVLLNENTDKLEGVRADAVLLATGGMHTMFAPNRHGCDGVAATLAFEAGAALKNPDQISLGGKYPLFAGGLVTSWDGETTVTGLYAAGECADGTAAAFPFSQALSMGAAVADHLCQTLPEPDPIEADYALASSVTAIQELLDVFRRTRGTRSPVAVERRIRETLHRTLDGERTVQQLKRGLLDIKVMRKQAARAGYDLGEGSYPALRLPALLHLLEVMLTTAAYRLLREDGELTAVLKNGRVVLSAKKGSNPLQGLPEAKPAQPAKAAPETVPAAAPATGQPAAPVTSAQPSPAANTQNGHQAETHSVRENPAPIPSQTPPPAAVTEENPAATAGKPSGSPQTGTGIDWNALGLLVNIAGTPDGSALPDGLDVLPGQLTLDGGDGLPDQLTLDGDSPLLETPPTPKPMPKSAQLERYLWAEPETPPTNSASEG